MNIKLRYSLYIVAITALHLFSQIFLNNIASHYFNAYITAAINGVLTIETYYWIRNLQGLSFFKVYWAIYGFRMMLLFSIILASMFSLERPLRTQYVGAFFLNYFTWLILEIVILVKERKLEKQNR